VLALAWLAPTLGITHTAEAAESVMFRHRSTEPKLTDRIIVKWRAAGVAALQIASVRGRAMHLRAVTGLDVDRGRHLFGTTDVMRLSYPASKEEMHDILARLNADPAVQYA